jgi:hypothetical protein
MLTAMLPHLGALPIIQTFNFSMKLWWYMYHSMKTSDPIKQTINYLSVSLRIPISPCVGRLKIKEWLTKKHSKY